MSGTSTGPVAAIDEFGNVHTRDRYGNVEGNTVHSLDAQLLGVARVQEGTLLRQAGGVGHLLDEHCLRQAAFGDGLVVSLL